MRWLPPTKPLSEHFQWREVLNRSGYDRLPLGPTYIGRGRFVLTPRRNARKHAASLELLRHGVNEARRLRELPPTYLRILSWARTQARNSAVGGAPDSQHLYLLATDIAREEIDRMLPFEGGRAIFDRLLESVYADGGVGLYPAGNRHCDSRGHRARWTAV